MCYGQTMADGSSWGTVDDTAQAGTVTDWGQWFQNVSGEAVKAALGAYTYRNVIQPANGIPAIGPDGRVYNEGQRVTYPGQTAGGGAINMNTLLLIGLAVGAVMLLKD